MRDVMDLSGHQEHGFIIYSLSSPDFSGLAKAFVPSAFPSAVSVLTSSAARPFLSCAAILIRYVRTLVDRLVDVHSRLLNGSRTADCVCRCGSPLRNSISAFPMRPLNGPVSRIVFCSSLARSFP